ncbi:MAG: peroxide stress protein YaaA [Pseudomonadota bacterium]
MLIVLSPAKKLDMSPVKGTRTTKPRFEAETAELIKAAQRLSTKDLQKLMGISETLADLNAGRFRDFGDQDTQAAAYAFAGDTYVGLEARSLDEDEMTFAKDHLRILSGLYGLLRPLDRIEPYRLEMGSRLKTAHGKSLYEFWGDKIARKINTDAKAAGTKTLINCASQEYFGAVDLDALNVDVVTPVFKEDKPAGPKVISFFAKQARGAMARFIIQNRLTDPASIKDFDLGGYAFREDLSSAEEPVFVRPEEAAKSAA